MSYKPKYNKAMDRDIKAAGRFLRAVRVHQHVTIRGLSAETGLATDWIYRFEHGKIKEPKVSNIYKMADRFGYKVELTIVPKTMENM